MYNHVRSSFWIIFGAKYVSKKSKKHMLSVHPVFMSSPFTEGTAMAQPNISNIYSFQPYSPKHIGKLKKNP